MSASGTSTIDFGAFPGSPESSVAVTGQTNILAGSLVEAWILPAATTNHTVSDHYANPPRIIAGEISAGTGFTIRGFSSDDLPVWGQWNVAWAWV
jgi:hypothetical protein